jgi:hypothetical protein
MALTKVSFAAGIDKQDSKYGAEGRWVDSDYVRFRYGLPEQIGGWAAFSDKNLIGVARDIWTWTALNGTPQLAVSTNKKVYAYNGGSWGDITPVTKTSVGKTITPTNASTVITVTDVAHGALVGDIVSFTTVSSPFGGTTGATFQIQYEVQTVIDLDNYTVKSPVTLSGTTPGTATIKYLYPIGNSIALSSYGWGTSTWGTSTWGTPRTSGVSLPPRIWSLDNFGENLVLCPAQGALYEWSPTTDDLGVAAHIVNGAPTSSAFILVSTPDRHLICFGTEGTIGSPSTRDPMLVRWSDTESLTDWTITATNSAGSQRLTDGNELVGAVRSRNQILVFTDNALYGMQYVGTPYTFGFQQLGTNCGGLSQNAAADVNGVCFWMSPQSFFVFDGTVKKLPCSVQDAVFNNFNYTQHQLVYAGLNSQFNEVTWFYPTANSTEIDGFVTYNYVENCWQQGTLARTTWRDRGVFDLPLATKWNPDSVSGAYPTVSGLSNGISVLYNQETGDSADGSNISSYVQSAFFDIADGDAISFVKRLVPDFSVQNDTMDFYAVSRAFSIAPDSPSSLTPYVFTSTTQKIDTRIRGRALSIKIESNSANNGWRFGTLRLDIQPDGMR